ncbi:8565_t:CDS:1, partial [Acaulospora morrowiae]
AQIIELIIKQPSASILLHGHQSYRDGSHEGEGGGNELDMIQSSFETKEPGSREM